MMVLGSGLLDAMFSSKLIAALFGTCCLLLFGGSMLTGATILFPSTKVIRYRETPVTFGFAVCLWLFCVVAAGGVVFSYTSRGQE